MKPHISPARVREVFTLDKKRWVLIWRVRLSNRAPCVGSDAGHLDNCGYIRIGVDGRLYLAHRLIWMFVTGEVPPEFLDHKNGKRTDNRFKNLRVVTKSGNQQNMRTARRDSSTGILGVMPGRMGKWRAEIRVGGKSKYLGEFKSKKEARAAYVAAKREFHPTCTI